MLSRAFKGLDVLKIQRFPRDEGFQGFKVQGLKGGRANRFSLIQRFKGSQGLKGFSKSFMGGYRASRFNCTPGRYPTPLGALI